MTEDQLKPALVKFLNWHSTLQPADKCTVHSEGGAGLFNKTTEQLVSDFLKLKVVTFSNHDPYEQVEFRDDAGKEFLIKRSESSGNLWLYRKHIDGGWVSMREITEGEVDMMLNRANKNLINN